MKLPFLSKNTEDSAPSSSWPWPYYCHQPRTLSFRAANEDPNMFRTLNSAYCLDETEDSGSTVYFSESEEDESAVIETAVRGLKSDKRLFFEPGETSSILEEAKRDCGFPHLKESLVISMESQDPYIDFRKSMEEMVRAYGLKDWDCLKELLDWYLRVNGKSNHGYILGAFVDLLVINSQVLLAQEMVVPIDNLSPSSPLSLYASSSSSSSSSSSYCFSSMSRTSVSLLEAEERDSSRACLSSLLGVEEEIELIE